MKQFKYLVKSLRAVLPILFVSVTVLNYVTCAVLTALFLIMNAPDLGKFTELAAWAIAIASVAVRLVLVFGGQLTPHTTIQNPMKHIVAAVIMGALAMYELHQLMSEISLHWFISAAFMMGLGVFIEITLVKIISDYTNIEIVSNDRIKAKIRKYVKQKAEFERFVDKIDSLENENLSGDEREAIESEIKHLFNGLEVKN